jgi:hypothetical protein
LWNIRVEFYRDKVRWHSVQLRSAVSYETIVSYLDLPSQVTVHRALTIDFLTERSDKENAARAENALQKAKDSDEIKLVGEVPGQEEPFEQNLPLWDDPDALPEEYSERALQ